MFKVTSDEYAIVITKDGHKVTVNCHYITFTAKNREERQWAESNGFLGAHGGRRGKHFYKPFSWRGAKFGQIRVGGAIFILRNFYKGNPSVVSTGHLSFKGAEYAQIEWHNGVRCPNCLNP